MKKEAAKIASVKFFIGLVLLTLLVGMVSAGDVAYIYKSKVQVDQTVVKAFEELGLTVDLIDEKSFNGKNLPPDFLDYRVLFVGDERFKNFRNFPIYTVPTIISNYYFGEEFGLTDHDGISLLGSTNPLSVKKDNRVVQVYTQATVNGVSIPYYYLSKENKASGVTTVAVTYTGDNFDLGSVIGYISAQTPLLNNKKTQKNMCFFGIIESKYWTSEAKQMFKECAQFVGVSCRNSLDCPATTNSTPYCINNNVYRDVNSFSCQNPGSIQSLCIAQNNSVLVKSCPGSCTNGVCVCQDKDHDGYDECAIGNDQDDRKEKDCDDNDAQVHPNASEICDGKDNDCDGIIDENNGMCEQGKLCSAGQCVAVACFNNSDCGTDGFIENKFCQTDDVYQKFKTFTCTNAGTLQSSCSFAIENRSVEDCDVGKICSNGMCIKQCRDQDSDAYDDCSFGETGDDGKVVDCNDNDTTINPGADDAQCNGKDNDCDILIDEDYIQTPTSCGVGECSATGMKQCVNGQEKNNCAPKNPSAEICDAKDNDCDGVTDEESNACGAGSICLMGSCTKDCIDKDSDTYDDCSIGDKDDDGKVVDCNDNDNKVYPGAQEICDGKDNDCDGTIDENNGMCEQGKICSAGQCTAVTCSKNSDCGVDGFIENKFCQTDDVYQKFKTFTCTNAGTLQSSCSFAIENRSVEDCGVGKICSQAMCVRDCVDKDSDTYDDCSIGDKDDDGKVVDCNDNDNKVYPGAQEICDGKDNDCDGTIDEESNDCGAGSICHLGSCQNIACSKESDCGTDGFIDGLFCGQTNDVYQNYRDWTCNNAGSVSSSCSQKVISKLVTNCEDRCSAGACISIVCDTDANCTDNNAYTKDTCANAGTIESYCTYQPIRCLKDVDCNDNDVSTKDSCINPGSTNSFCKYEDIICLKNSDCGADGFVDGLFCSGNNDVYQNYRKWICEYAGTPSSSCTQVVEQRLVSDCKNSCSAGACVTIICASDNDCRDLNPRTVDRCNNAGTPNSFCTHDAVACFKNSDCGIDRYEGPFMCSEDDVTRNFVRYRCNNPGNQNSFCSTNVEEKFIQSCQYSCSQGNCIRCSTNSDCDDGKSITIDSCRFAGSIDSYCKYEIMQCASDQSCGTNGFVGAPFCKNGDVYQQYRNWMCKNPSASGSFCSYNDEETFVENCEFGCLNGRCKATTQCANINDDDHDGLIDAQDPGCWTNIADPNTYDRTLNNEARAGVACFTDDICGRDGFSGSAFCQQGDAYKHYKTYVCTNPGTGIAACSSMQEPRLVEECSAQENCVQGQCVHILCSRNSDCGTDGFVDGNYCKDGHAYQDYTTFKCINPATSASRCSVLSQPRIVEQCSAAEFCSDGFCYAKCFDKDKDGFDTCSPGDFGDDGKIVDCNDNDATINPGANDAQCNGKDNDCDILIDEDYVQTPTSCGVGECSATGMKQCVNGQEKNNCAPKNPSAEICDAKDNDCDGIVDENNGMCPANKMCVAGECLNIVCHKDSDCGEDKFIGETFCKNNDVYKNFKVFSCIDPGSTLSVCHSQVDPILVEDCTSGEVCTNGQCVLIVQQCADKDNDGYDICSPGNPGDDGKIVDCNDNDNKVYPGAQEICDGKDNDCDGTIDENNGMCEQGKICSAGSCVPVTCSKNSDCGADGFVGSTFCQSDDSYQNFKQFICNNPGAQNSFCSFNSEPRLKENCAFSCSQGQCSGNCKADSDCPADFYSDNYCSNTTVKKDLHDFSCVSFFCKETVTKETAEQCSGVCTNGMCFDVRCSKDSDCGANGFVDGKYCRDGGVYQDFKEYTCNNPRTQFSSCSSNREPRIIEECSVNQICNKGMCIIPCLDSDRDKYDTCSPGNPGDDGKVIDCNDNDATINPGADDAQCNGKDNDCDILIDEDYIQTPTSCGVGECSATGMKQCVNGQEKNNCAPKNPSAEICDAKDNDCDGTIDENNGMCEQGKICLMGSCTKDCVDKDSDTYDDCSIGDKDDDGKIVDCNDNDNKVYPGAQEICDGKDNDCDGTIDENNGMCEQGKICSAGSCVPVTCSKNSDCGADGFIENKFCQTDDVYQKFKTFTCNNAGTSTSSCSWNVDLKLVENCAATCANGQCTSGTVCTNRYATQLIANSPAYTGYQPNPTITVAGGAEKVLGAPQRVVHTSDVNFDNIGNTPGFVTVGFEGSTVISDKTGNDVRIHLNDLNEAFEVFASVDGVSFVSIGKSTSHGAASQPAQVDFDLNTGGIQTAKQIKIVNSVVQSGTNEGPDIDAIEIVSC